MPNSGGRRLNAKITPAIPLLVPCRIPFAARYISARDKTRPRACRAVNRKKFFALLGPVDSRIHGATNQTEHLVHGTDPSGSRSEFLTAYPHTPDSIRHPPVTPFSRPAVGRHDILSLFTRRALARPRASDNAAGKSPRFSWISRNHGLKSRRARRSCAPRCRVC